MFFLQATKSSVSLVLFLGTIGMVILVVALVIFIILHQRRVLRFQNKINQMEQEQQKILLNASIKLQEEERQRLAADLHDDAGPAARHRPSVPEREPGEPGQSHAASIHLPGPADHR